MTDQLSVTAERLDEVTIMLEQLGGEAHLRLMNAVEAQAQMFQAVVVGEKLSGGVLNARTGTLRDSIHTEISDSSAGVMATVGTNVVYARIHEYGGIIHHPGGTAFYLGGDGMAHFVSNDAMMFTGSLPRTKPHDIPMPERSYLRSTLAERADEIRLALAAAVAGRA